MNAQQLRMRQRYDQIRIAWARSPDLGLSDLASRFGVSAKVIGVALGRTSPTHHAQYEGTCPVPGCSESIMPELVCCPPHWRRVPHELQVAIWRAYRPGQHASGWDGAPLPSEEYERLRDQALEILRDSPPVEKKRGDRQ